MKVNLTPDLCKMNYMHYVLSVTLLFVSISGQSYEDKRCKCICPSLAAVLNGTGSVERKLFIANVPPNKCNCDGVILPRISEDVKGREQEFCPRCDCKYESRNTTVIKVVVVIVIWVVTLLMIYMVFLVCLNPLVHKRRPKFYQETATDEVRNLLMAGDDAED